MAGDRPAAGRVSRTKPLTLGRAWDILDGCIPAIAATCPDLHSIEPAGEIRRIEPLVSTIVLVAQTDDVAATAKALAASQPLAPVIKRSDRHLVCTYRNAAVEVLLTGREAHGSTLFLATGSDVHVDEMRRRGLRNQPQPTEDALYSSLGLAFIAPELRHGRGEVEAAATGHLPQLVDISRHARRSAHAHDLQ